jgi:hypothetical protein
MAEERAARKTKKVVLQGAAIFIWSASIPPLALKSGRLGQH